MTWITLWLTLWSILGFLKPFIIAGTIDRQTDRDTASNAYRGTSYRDSHTKIYSLRNSLENMDRTAGGVQLAVIW